MRQVSNTVLDWRERLNLQDHMSLIVKPDCKNGVLQERLAPSAITHAMLHPCNTKQQANPHGS